MAEKYFGTVLRNLDNKAKTMKPKVDFITLKGYEYWIRTLRLQKAKPDASDCIGILPMANGKRILQDLVNYYEDTAEKANGLPGGIRDPFMDIDDDDCFQITSEEEKAHQAKKRRKLAQILDHFVKNAGASDDICRIVNRHLEHEAIFDAGAQKVFFDSLERELYSIIQQSADMEDDHYLKRIKIMEKTLNLDETELEFTLFSWIFANKDVCAPIRGMGRGLGFRDNGLLDAFTSLFPELSLEKAMANDGTLKRMNVVDDDLDISRRIGFFLDGNSGNDIDSLYCRIYKGKNVPYQELCKGNPKVELMFEMLKNNPVGQGLNVFFYGVEGTGKTELAKAIAHELKRPLITTVVSTDGIHKDSINKSPLGERMGSILFAANKYQNQQAIILVDEADLILNCCEKGALNFFLEQIKVPVIWISNNTEWIEASSLRRFDYSLRFERLDAEKRLDMWHSVIREQHAQRLFTEEMVQNCANTYPITAGGITQAVAAAKRLKKSGSTIPTMEIVQQVASAQADLLDLPLEYVSRDKESHAPNYVLDVLNIDSELKHVQRVMKSFDAKWKQMQEQDKPDSLNILFYGPPGTGKTELAKYMARSLNRKLVIRKASDLLGPFVGMTERNIRKMFQEAEQKKAILFLDEADSMIQERAGAGQNWEVTQVNELLTQMENFKGIFIAATNFNDKLDQASRRRFALKIKFNYLKPEGVEKMWQSFFPTLECPVALREIRQLAPGDFNTVYSSMRFYEPEELSPEKILEALKHEVACKDTREGRRMGL